MTRDAKKKSVSISNVSVIYPKNHLILEQKLLIKKCDYFQNSHVSINRIYFYNSNLHNFIVNGSSREAYTQFLIQISKKLILVVIITFERS